MGAPKSPTPYRRIGVKRACFCRPESGGHDHRNRWSRTRNRWSRCRNEEKLPMSGTVVTITGIGAHNQRNTHLLTRFPPKRGSAHPTWSIPSYLGTTRRTPTRRQRLGLLQHSLHSGVLEIGRVAVLPQDALHQHPHPCAGRVPVGPVDRYVFAQTHQQFVGDQRKHPPNPH